MVEIQTATENAEKSHGLTTDERGLKSAGGPMHPYDEKIPESPRSEKETTIADDLKSEDTDRVPDQPTVIAEHLKEIAAQQTDLKTGEEL